MNYLKNGQRVNILETRQCFSEDNIPDNPATPVTGAKTGSEGVAISVLLIAWFLRFFLCRVPDVRLESSPDIT